MKQKRLRHSSTIFFLHAPILPCWIVPAGGCVTASLSLARASYSWSWAVPSFFRVFLFLLIAYSSHHLSLHESTCCSSTHLLWSATFRISVVSVSWRLRAGAVRRAECQRPLVSVSEAPHKTTAVVQFSTE
jgi:hypothetical protein